MLLQVIHTYYIRSFSRGECERTIVVSTMVLEDNNEYLIAVGSPNNEDFRFEKVQIHW